MRRYAYRPRWLTLVAWGGARWGAGCVMAVAVCSPAFAAELPFDVSMALHRPASVSWAPFAVAPGAPIAPNVEVRIVHPARLTAGVLVVTGRPGGEVTVTASGAMAPNGRVQVGRMNVAGRARLDGDGYLHPLPVRIVANRPPGGRGGYPNGATTLRVVYQ